MSRPGVSYADVAVAASELMEDGVNPTIEQIRRKLGTGSSTTISNHLREWKGRSTSLTVTSIKESLPHDLVSTVKGLWERVIDQSEEKIQSAEAEAGKKLESLEVDLQKYKNNNRRWQQLFQRWQSEKAELQTKLDEMTRLVSQQQLDVQELTFDNKILQDQLSQRNQELVNLREDVRHNQEHSNKLYTELQERYEKELLSAKEQLNQAKQENIMLLTEKREIQFQLQQNKHTNVFILQEYCYLMSAFSAKENELQHMETTNRVYEIEIANLKIMNQDMQKMMQVKESKEMDLIAQLKFSSQFLETANNQVQQEREKNRLVMQENNELKVKMANKDVA